MRDDRLTRTAVDGGIRVSRTIPLPSDRLIPREHWVGVAVQCRYALHVGFENGRIVVTDVEMDDMVMLVQKPRKPLTGKPDYTSDGEMMSAVFAAGQKRENTTLLLVVVGAPSFRAGGETSAITRVVVI